MMSRAILNILSWEERCIPALEKALLELDCRLAICFIDRRYQHRTDSNRYRLEELALKLDVSVEFIVFDFDDSISSYHTIRRQIERVVELGILEVGFDITTAPRNIIWTTLSALQLAYPTVKVFYTAAERYGGWQTKEDKEPKLILNRSGIMYPDKPTCVLILTGWELARVERVFYRFEPRKAIILRDIHAKDYGEIRDVDLTFRSVTEIIPFDNKDVSDEHLRQLIDIVEPFVEKYNILCCSFGPKLGAVLLYRLVTTFESIGLAYVPAGEHNPEVSTGIGYSTNFDLNFRCLVPSSP